MANETNTGWVRLYRSTLGREWFDDPLTLQLWVVCLLKANYLPTRCQGAEIERGAFVTSVDGLCKETGQTARQIRTRLAKLQESGEISVQATNRKSIITVCKFNIYQPIKFESDKQATNKTTNSKHDITQLYSTCYNDAFFQNDKQNDNSIRIYKEEYKELKESLSSRARATEAERETFFEIFFFKNFQNPDYEVERFCANYRPPGACADMDAGR